VGPFVCTGLYDISRRIERGETVRLADTVAAWRANLGAFSLFALALTIILLIWARASLVTFALFFSTGMPTLTNFLARVASPEHWDFIVTYFAVGGLFAALVFAISVVSVPMMLDRGTDTVVAALTSVRALLANPGPLALWALLIVLVIGMGFATLRPRRRRAGRRPRDLACLSRPGRARQRRLRTRARRSSRPPGGAVSGCRRVAVDPGAIARPLEARARDQALRVRARAGAREANRSIRLLAQERRDVEAVGARVFHRRHTSLRLLA